MTNRERALVSSLVAECVDRPQDSPILADVLDQTAPALARSLRLACHLPDLWEAAKHGTMAARHARRRCVKLLEGWGRVVSLARRVNDRQAPTGPEFLPGHPTLPSLREAEGSEAYRLRLHRTTGPQRMRELRSQAHCRRLCRRALCGEDVPPDVQRQCAEAVARIRALLRGIAAEWTMDDSTDVVNLQPLSQED